MAVYVAAPLCEEARQELSRAGARAGDVKVRAICVAPTRRGGRLDLAIVGANARRATEDSAAIAFIGEAEPAARFTRPILDEAGITLITSSSGSRATSTLLDAIAEADPDSGLRESLYGSLR